MSTVTARKPIAEDHPRTESVACPALLRYIYCIIDCVEPLQFDCQAIDDGPRDIHTVVHQNVAAVVSSATRIKYSIDRKNTVAHQRVMEHVMERGHTVLPVKFATIAEAKNNEEPEERILQQVLVKRFHELSSLLGVMKTRAEMGIKALWRDMNVIYQEILDSDAEMTRLRGKLAQQKGKTGRPSPRQGGTVFNDQVKLGELVKNALDEKKTFERTALLNLVRHSVVDINQNSTFGDQMFANLALLVEQSQCEELDRMLDVLAEKGLDRIKLKYVGPMPPSNFIELVINWDE